MKDQRRLVAREAASLLYYGLAHEYLQAKEKAAKTLGARVLPSNLEVALELGRLAEELEGPGYFKRLERMRREALKLMELLADFNPRLVGSVWRGVIHRASDVDVEVYSRNPDEVVERLRGKFRELRVEHLVMDEGGRLVESTHIHLTLPSGDEAEVVVRSPEELGKVRTCEIFGDPITGLTLEELRLMLRENPHRKFLPEK